MSTTKRTDLTRRLTQLERAGRGRAFTADEQKSWDSAVDEIQRLDEQHDRRQTDLDRVRDAMDAGHFEGGASGQQYHGTTGGNLRGQLWLERGQSFGDWQYANGHADRPTERVSFDRFIRATITGDWKGAEAERALTEGTSTAGGVLVPTPLAGQVIDLVRNASRVFQAGAVTVPMTANTLKIPRLTAENAPAWRSEGGTITAADLTFDSVTFTAQSLDRLVILSRELLEDSDPTSAQEVITHSFAEQIATELDRTALRGTGTPPVPRGVLNQSGITTTAHGTNGSVIGSPPAAGTMGWEFLAQSLSVVQGNNFPGPYAQIMAPRSNQSLSLLRDTTNQYIAPPAFLDGVPRYVTKQVPINLTVGTSTDCSEVYTGQWNMLGVGLRNGFRIQMLTERYADTGQIGFIANLRADVQLFQPSAFVVDTGVRG